MPDTYPNPYQTTSPIGAALQNLSGVIMSGPNEAQRIYQAEEALKLKNAREAGSSLGSMFQKYGTPAYDPRAAAAAAATGGLDPAKLAEYDRYLAPNVLGVNDPKTSAAFVGAGGSYGSSPAGFATAQNNEMERARLTQAGENQRSENTPQTVGSPTGPVVVRRADSYGQPAVEDIGKVQGDAARRVMNASGGLDGASAATKRFIHVDSTQNPTPHNYMTPQGTNTVTYDGITDARSGQPLPPGGAIVGGQDTLAGMGITQPSVRADLQKSDIANQRFKSLIGFTRNLASQDQANFGVTGFVKGLVQDANQTTANVAQGLGFPDIKTAVENVRQKALSQGVSPNVLSGVFDPKLSSLHTAADLLVYSAAEALTGQTGRSVSDKDIKFIKEITGDPREWMGSQEKYLSKLDTLEQVLGLNQEVVDRNLRRAPNSGAAPAAPGAVPPAVPPAPGAPQPPVIRKYNPATGRIE